jgi:putative ABC transport system permease protein
MQTLLQDMRYSARMLTKNPGFTSIAIITLALGIGVNSAIFSVVNALLVRPLPFENLDRIVALWERVPSRGVERNENAAANYFDWSKQQTSFERTGMYRGWSANLTGDDNPENLVGHQITASLFDVLGVKPQYGRAFTAEEEQPDKKNVVILKYGFWQRRFAGDLGIIGKTISINDVPRTVVGIMPPDFNFPPGGQLLAPLALTPNEARNRMSHYLLAVARLKTGIPLEQAQAELDTIMARLERQYPNYNTGRGLGVFPLLDDTVRYYRNALLTLMSAVGFVLLIACANVANLMLARAAGRDKEIAIRTALGASRWRIVRGLFSESLLLALIGGGAGVLLAFWASDLIKSVIPAEFFDFVPGWRQIGVDLRVLSFTFALSLFTGVIFGLAPALQASRPDLNVSLKDKSSIGLGGSRKRRLRSALVITEVALSFVLLIGAGLMMKSFIRLIGTDPGFNPANVLTMELTLPYAKYGEASQRENFYRQLLERIESLPGVESAGAVNHLPLGGSNTSSSFLVEGFPEPPPGQDVDGRLRVCSPHYFQALGMTLLEGRAFTDQDRTGSQPVVIVNKTLAQRYWPNGSAIGKRIRFTGDQARNPWMQIVGVVRDVKHELNLEVVPEYYLPHAQDAWGEMILASRTRGEPDALAAAIRAEVSKLDKDQPVSRIRTMEQVSADSTMLQRHSVSALGVFAALALLLAAIGLYGVMSYTVTQRTNEIGIRIALGANPRDVLKLVIAQGMALVSIGMAVGLIASLGLTRLIETLLFKVKPTDIFTFSVSAALLAIVALLACWIPARRAAKVDPMVALRQE